jgi:hypothetical protein
MKYIINEHQYNLLLEQEEQILRVPFVAFGNDWDVLQRFLERRGNPPYEIMDDLNLSYSKIESLGNLTSVGGYLIIGLGNIESLGNLTSVGGHVMFLNTNITSLGNLTSVGGDINVGGNKKLKSLGNLTSVGGNLTISKTPLAKKYSGEEIRSMVEVGGWVYV